MNTADPRLTRSHPAQQPGLADCVDLSKDRFRVLDFYQYLKVQRRCGIGLSSPQVRCQAHPPSVRGMIQPGIPGSCNPLMDLNHGFIQRQSFTLAIKPSGKRRTPPTPIPRGLYSVRASLWTSRCKFVLLPNDSSSVNDSNSALAATS